MPSRFTSLRATARRHRVALAAGTAAMVLAGGGTTAAFAASSAPAAPTASTTPATAATATPCAPGVGALLRAAPRSLRTDLQHLRKDSAGNRAADRAAIRAKALAGGYGVRIERVAGIVAGRSGVAAALPEALKADLKTLRADPKGSDARKQQAATIWSKALAGSYGTSVESLAKEAKARTDARCAAEKPAS